MRGESPGCLDTELYGETHEKVPGSAFPLTDPRRFRVNSLEFVFSPAIREQQWTLLFLRDGLGMTSCKQFTVQKRYPLDRPCIIKYRSKKGARPTGLALPPSPRTSKSVAIWRSQNLCSRLPASSFANSALPPRPLRSSFALVLSNLKSEPKSLSIRTLRKKRGGGGYHPVIHRLDYRVRPVSCRKMVCLNHRRSGATCYAPTVSQRLALATRTALDRRK